MFDRFRTASITVLGVLLCLFTVLEVNFPQLQPQSALAVFVMLGLVICYLTYPLHPRFEKSIPFRSVDMLLALLTVICCGYVIVQTERFFNDYWALGLMLGDRAGQETSTDYIIGLTGVILVLEATRRSIGWIVPLLALSFMAHSYYCYGSMEYLWPEMPDWLLPHAGQNLKEISSTTFLQTLGVFGPAAGVMFKYVFLFVIFGAFLEMSGATQFIIDFAESVFGQSPGGPAKVSVLGSGLMGSLSGSAVANAVTTGSFTIPMMRNAGFQPHIAGGITAAAASGGALVPPVMGAGAYMMLELVEPQVTFLQIAKAALVPAALYYFSIYYIVHFYSKRMGAGAADPNAVTFFKMLRLLVTFQWGQAIRIIYSWLKNAAKSFREYEALVFFSALGALVSLLLLGFSPFRAVTGSLVLILALSTLRKKLQLGTGPRVLALVSFFVVLLGHQLLFAETVANPSGRQIFESWLSSSIFGMFGLLIFGLIHPVWRPSMLDALTKSAKNGISLVAASACVGIIIGVVQQTGIASDFSSVIKSVVETNLFMALIGIMACSIVLGMGVPSVVCYLLMATLMGSLLSELGVIPLAAHLFIFYFGMMSMVTPPVALAAYASASIAEAKIMPTAFAAFRFSLVGFTLPFMFIYRPELLLLSDKPEIADLSIPKQLETSETNAPVSGTLQWAGKPVTETRMEFLPVDGSGSDQTLETDSLAQFNIPLSPGRWNVASFTEEGERLHLGVIDIDLSRMVEVDVDPDKITLPETQDGTKVQAPLGKKLVDKRILFEDQRLSLVAVFLAVLSALVGITALAAGIAGFLFSELRIGVRTGMLIAAALLLSPDVEIAGHQIGLYTNIGGGLLFAATVVINKMNANKQKDVASPQEVS